MSENRVDPTVAGLFLVSFITLVFGLLGLQMGADLNWNMDFVALGLAPVVGLIFIVLAVSAIRCGNAFAAALFVFVSIALIAVPIAFGVGAFVAFFLIAAIFLVFAIISFLVGAPKLLMLILIFTAVIYLGVGLTINGSSSSIAYIFALGGILAGVLSLYLGFALSTQKLPVF
jgi:hypothetical protein